ncbi:MAG: rhodanese-like domain-containing protein [bacterium]|nr:rhodanese-like domain-containing protein [bacterium]
MRISIGLIVLFFLTVGCSTPGSDWEAGASAGPQVVIDVRTVQEFNSGHIKGAVNIPYDEIGSRITEAVKEKDEKIVLYCQSGRRSGIALSTLREMGYTQVENAGGYESLKLKLGQ